MKATRLLQHFDTISEAPDAVARLRRLILDLAVRGKLVEQQVGDEPASTLLERIRSEHLRLAAAGEIKKSKSTVAIEKAPPVYSVPDGWQLTTLLSLCTSVTDGDHLPPPKTVDGVPLLVIGNIRTGQVRFANCRYVSRAYYDALDAIRRPRAGDLLYTLVGSYGIPVEVLSDEQFCVQRHIGILRPSKLISSAFLARALDSALVLEQATACATGIAQKTVPLTGLRKFVIPLPPIAEQRRIVTKVDELMALCDQLQAARDTREQQRDRLVAAGLHRLTVPDTAEGDEGAELGARRAENARFHLQQLPRLSTRQEHIKQLRQTILNLAVRGKLVAQDPKEESPQLSQSMTEALPDELPMSWCFSRLVKLLAEDTRNGYSRRPDDAPDGTPILRISAGTVRRDGIVAEEEHKLISGIDPEARLQYGLRSGDLLACRFNGNKAFVGRLTIFNDYLGIRPIYPDKLIRVRVDAQLVLPTFIQIAGGTDLVRGEVEDACATTVGNWGISASNLKQVRFPVPPLAEQHRIVARVDELMALCDQLEASLATSQSGRTRLLDALLHEALDEAA